MLRWREAAEKERVWIVDPYVTDGWMLTKYFVSNAISEMYDGSTIHTRSFSAASRHRSMHVVPISRRKILDAWPSAVQRFHAVQHALMNPLDNFVRHAIVRRVPHHSARRFGQRLIVSPCSLGRASPHVSALCPEQPRQRLGPHRMHASG